MVRSEWLCSVIGTGGEYSVDDLIHELMVWVAVADDPGRDWQRWNCCWIVTTHQWVNRFRACRLQTSCRAEDQPILLLLVRDYAAHHLWSMTEIFDFHAHIYFNAEELEHAQTLARAAQEKFNLSVGHFHQKPVGPHPRGSCQLTVAPGDFGQFATWAAVHRGTLTIFAHASTGNDRADHTMHVVWFGPSEELDLSIFS